MNQEKPGLAEDPSNGDPDAMDKKYPFETSARIENNQRPDDSPCAAGFTKQRSFLPGPTDSVPDPAWVHLETKYGMYLAVSLL